MPIHEETKITFSEAARRQPRLRADRPCSPQTITRWATSGVKVSGQVIKLEVTQHGGARVTTVEALARFHAACADAADGKLVNSTAIHAAGLPSEGAAGSPLVTA